MDDELLTTDEIAEILKVKRITVVRAMRDGKMPGAFKIAEQWRIKRSDFDKYIDSLIRKTNEKES